MQAHVLFAPALDRVRITVAGGSARGDALSLKFVHRTRAGQDRMVPLQHAGGAAYEASLDGSFDGHWRILLEDEAATWRLTGDWDAPARTLVLRPNVKDVP
jgi:hypothetical protein